MSPQELIKKSQRITVSLGPQTQSRDMVDALLLLSTLSRLGKEICLEQNTQIPGAFAWVDTPSLTTKTSVLAIRDIAPFLSKISYEKNERDLMFSLALKENSLDLSRVELKKTPEADLTLMVGENAGQHNQDITFNPHARIWNARKALEAGIELLSPFHIPLMRLLQRTLLKLEYSPNKNLCTVLFERKDFIETQTHTKALASIANELTQRGTAASSHLLLFPQSSKKSQGLFGTRQELLRKKIAGALGGKEKGNWILFESPNTSLQDIKENFISLL